MKKNNLFLIVILILFSCTNKSEFLKKYPYGLITKNDYGILNENDFKKEAENAYPMPFSEKSWAYAYWQCFDTSKIKIFCNEKDLEIVVSDGNIKNSYVTRHAIEEEDCLERKAETYAILKGEAFFCVLGSLPSTEISENIKIRSWFYHKVKTKKGCTSWFENDC